MTLRPCITCGEPSDGPRCPEHTRDWRPKAPAAERGYDAAWERLSRRARRLQPWCSDCGATADLQLDHLPIAWERKAKRLRIRLGLDAQVVCGRCNRRRGAARPANTLVTPTRGVTPGRGRKHPRSEAKFELHTEIRTQRARPANSAAS